MTFSKTEENEIKQNGVQKNGMPQQEIENNDPQLNVI
jgi:hypothetical protein